MQHHISYKDVPKADQGAVVAMGNFDGVHLGHQSVLDFAKGICAKTNAPLGIVTFEPHPRRFFMPSTPDFRLMSAYGRARRFELLEIDQLYELPFGAELASLAAEEFALDVLGDGLGVSHVVVGADFKFGKGRSGDTDTLIALGKQAGFKVTIAPLVADAAGEYSSTAIRNALAEGRPDSAAKMLGHWHRIHGIVEHGEKRGRELGFPTANMSLAGLHCPKMGIYAVLVDVLDGPHRGAYHGVASLGTRPTFGENIPNLEVFLLDFTGDLYDNWLSVALVAFQRPELKFDGIDPLIVQMKEDTIEARRILQSL